MPSIAQPKFKWEDLPCTEYNGLRAYTIYVEACETDPVKTPLPDLGITWEDSPSWVKAAERVNESLQGYRLKSQSAAGNGRLFTYGKELSESQRVTPFYVETETRQQFWPTVLQKLWFTDDKDSDGKSHLREHSRYRVGQTYPTAVVSKHYLSDTPWPSTRFKRPFPITDTVKYDFQSISGSFPECLHPYCRFSTVQNGSRVVYGEGTIETEIGGEVVAQEFPSTPMTDWEPYIAEIQTIKVMGQYHYIETWLMPPIDDREITA